MLENGLPITALYGGLIAVLMAVLSSAVGASRGKHNVALGDGENPAMNLAIRRFGNLSEYAAMVIVVLALMEVSGVSSFWLHIYGAGFVALRVIHPISLFDTMEAPLWQKVGRFVSALGTAILLAAGGIVLVAGSLG